MLSATNKDHGCCPKDECADLAHKAGHKLRQVIDTASDDARDATATVIKEVREHPVKSSAIAAGAGFLLGLLLRRR